MGCAEDRCAQRTAVCRGVCRGPVSAENSCVQRTGVCRGQVCAGDRGVEHGSALWAGEGRDEPQHVVGSV